MLVQKIVSDLTIQSSMKFANHTNAEDLSDVFHMKNNCLYMSTNYRRSVGWNRSFSMKGIMITS